MQVKCPNCGDAVEWKKSKWRPFCSERCKMADLGAWVLEDYKIPEKPVSYENIKHIKDDGDGK